MALCDISLRILGRKMSTLVKPEYLLCDPKFTLWPRFFAPCEQRTLLSAALERLDRTETRRARQQMKKYQRNLASSSSASTETGLHHLFLPDDYYDFQEGHYDGVIHHFREMHLNSWPEDELVGLPVILRRLYALCPSQNVQTHLLHLASYGEILPHVDNISASGSWIMGVSLGGERILRMQGPAGDHDAFEIPLPSGSVYLQRDSMRFQYKHSVLRSKLSESSDLRKGQRLSIMIRDLPQTFKHD